MRQVNVSWKRPPASHTPMPAPQGVRVGDCPWKSPEHAITLFPKIYLHSWSAARLRWSTIPVIEREPLGFRRSLIQRNRISLPSSGRTCMWSDIATSIVSLTAVLIPYRSASTTLPEMKALSCNRPDRGCSPGVPGPTSLIPATNPRNEVSSGKRRGSTGNGRVKTCFPKSRRDSLSFLFDACQFLREVPLIGDVFHNAIDIGDLSVLIKGCQGRNKDMGN
jgi:hypothetical protein